MSKLSHKLLGLTAAGAAIGAGVLYFLKKKDSDAEDDFYDFEEGDFDQDEEIDAAERGYVSLTPSSKADEDSQASAEETTSEEVVTEEAVAADEADAEEAVTADEAATEEAVAADEAVTADEADADETATEETEESDAPVQNADSAETEPEPQAE